MRGSLTTTAVQGTNEGTSELMGSAGVESVAAPDASVTRAAVAAAVRAGLTKSRKTLPPWLLYDETGSALFEEITALPEYYLTRTERAILQASSGEIIDAAGLPLEIVELGAGSATKTSLLLEALLTRQPTALYTPVDVSPTALRLAVAELRRFRRLHVRPILARYPDDLVLPERSAERRLVVFLGSNIGNYQPSEARALLAGVRARLEPGDAFLLGADLAKSPRLLRPAYDDAAGVTARFNLNVLRRLNRELGAGFDLDRFRHVVKWNAAASRMELYLESTIAQTVPIHALGTEIALGRGERIHTESSYKLTRSALRRLLVDAGFKPEAKWHDVRGWFGLFLARVARVPARRRSRVGAS
jgi:L-histidine Nalpha-methyltransferase